MERAEPGPMKVGAPIYLHELRRFVMVHPPEVDATRVGFIFLYHRGGGTYSVAFNFSLDAYPEGDADWDLGFRMAEYLNEIHRERVVRQFGVAGAERLSEFGLFMAPAIMPYPLSAIVVALNDGRSDVATSLLRDNCGRTLWDVRSFSWWTSPLVSRRRAAVGEALDAHYRHHFHTSIYTLYPTIVGIIGDFIVQMDPGNSTVTSDYRKAELFVALAEPLLPNSYAWRAILSAPLQFLSKGPFFAKFTDWGQPIDTRFPSRHVVAHGKYTDDLFTEMNSLKALLLLDAVATVLDALKPPLPGEEKGSFDPTLGLAAT